MQSYWDPARAKAGYKGHFQLIKTHSPLYGKGSCPVQTSGSSSSDEHIETKPMARKSRWEAMLKGRDRELLSAMIEIPWLQGGQSHVLVRRDPDCREDDVVSTSEDERRIAAILNLVDPMMDWCEQTVRSTSRNILRWVRSVKLLSSSPEPFQLVRQPSSTRKYRYLQKKLLAFVLRAYRLDLVVRRRLTKIRLSTQLLRLLDRLWQNQYWDSDGQQTSGARTTAVVSRDFINPSLDEEVDRIDHTNDHGGDDENDDENDEETDDETDDRGDLEGEYDSDDDCDGSAYAGSGHYEVLELLFGLSVALFEERPIDERSDSMLAVLFSSVLGYSKTRQSFLQARDFTTHLSALIYNQRLVLLERALPVRAYPGLGIEARPRSNQLQRLNEVRKRFLVTGSASSFDEFFNLRNYGRVAAQSDTPHSYCIGTTTASQYGGRIHRHCLCPNLDSCQGS
ncbi:hypothetical protein X797_011646 [Metarhizium robertsii]|uniref:Uncharacterized protein n=1 Tax=Metarhizium robertsii TaxID=568076 RepID=A0A014N6E4_9HYPO|nr:hypothetical protein X797_011646 [Metarhizium robertsii]